MRAGYAAVVFGLLVAVLCVQPAAAKTVEQWAREFGINTDASYDATRVMETKDGELRFKEYKTPDKMRTEVSMGGMNGIVIRRDDLGVSYFVMLEMGMYRKLNNKEASQAADGFLLSRVEEVGREEVNGFASRKFKTHFKDQHGKGAGFIWITDDGVNIKSDMLYKSSGMKGQRMKFELVDLKLRPQDPAHFEVPEGMQPMTLGSMMGMAQRVDRETGGAPNREERGASQRNPSLAEEAGQAAEQETRRGVVNETRKAVRDGFRKLFKRD